MIYFVTVNYYAADLIQTLLQSIQAATDAPYRIVIVNNSPADQSVENFAISDCITVITADRNLGFGGGCNLGIQFVYERDPNALIWLINPDAELEPNAVAYVQDCLAQDNAIAILGTRIQDLTGRLWFSLGTYNPWLGSLKHQFEAVECSITPVRTHPTRWVSGCSLILNLAQFDHCPLFDTQYFLDYEDADLCERYYQKGYRLRVTQAVLVKHRVSAITHRNQRAKFQHATFSKLYFLHQHGTAIALGLNLVYILAKVLVLLPRQPEIAVGRWRGLKDFIHWKIMRLSQPQKVFKPQTSFTTMTETTGGKLEP